VVGGMVGGVLGALLCDAPQGIVAAAVAGVVGALAPDADTPGSLAGRCVPGSAAGQVGRLAAGTALIVAGFHGLPWGLPAGVVTLILGLVRHRGVFHSPLVPALLAIAGAAAWWAGNPYAGLVLAGSLGYGSHLALDSLR